MLNFPFLKNPCCNKPVFLSSILFSLLSLMAFDAVATPNARDGIWATNGTVYSSASVGSNIGGDTGAGVVVDILTELVDTQFPVVSGGVSGTGVINAVVPDGQGGWYIGGDFSTVAGQKRNNIAHIRSNKTLNEGWDPDCNGEIFAMQLSDKTLFIGGNFTEVGSKQLNRLAALDIAGVGNNIVRTWNPNVNGVVRSILLPPAADAGGRLYIGGDFTSVNGKDRNYLAVLSDNILIDLNSVDPAAEKLVSDWNPDPDAAVNTMVLSGSILYVGGDFTKFDSSSTAPPPIMRSYIAALDITANKVGEYVVQWNPVINNAVRTMVLSGSTLYVGGDFTSVGIDSRNYVAAIEIGSGSPTKWDPDFNNIVRSMVLNETTLYVGGDFTKVNSSKTRNNLAALDTTVDINNALDLKVNATDSVRMLALYEDSLFMGGSFTSVIDESTLYIGGDFDYVGPRTGAGVVIDTSNAAVVGGVPEVIGTVNAVIPDGVGGWYIGGDFVSVGGVPRNNIAHIKSDITDPVDLAWNPDANGAVNAIVLSSDAIPQLYVGGGFTSVGGNALPYIAKIVAATGAVDIVWKPGVTGGAVNSLALSSDDVELYLGGAFTTVTNGAVNPHPYIAKVLTADTGLVVDAWDPGVTGGAVNSLVLSSGDVGIYLGGAFSAVSNGAILKVHSYVAKVFTAGTGLVDDNWDPDVNDVVNSLYLSSLDDKLYLGGKFTTFNAGTNSVPYVARVVTAGTGGVNAAWNNNVDPGPGNVVNTVVLSSDDNTLYVGGDFKRIGGVARHKLAALDTTTIDPAAIAIDWRPAVGGTVKALAVSGSTLYTGGDFDSVGGVVRKNIAALDLATGQPTSWDPQANNIVRTLLLNDDNTRLYAGGDFTAIGGQFRNRVAELNISGIGTATSWNPNVDGTVNAMVLAADSLFIGGDFTFVDTVARNHLASLDTKKTIDIVTTWNPDMSNGTSVHSMLRATATMYIGGDFTTISGKTRNHLAEVLLFTATDNVTDWHPSVGGPVYAMTLRENILYIGGDFVSVGSDTRNHLAALDRMVTTDIVTDWSAGADNIVRTVEFSNNGTSLYIGGDFGVVNYKDESGITHFQAHNRLALLDIDSSIPVKSWKVDADASVYSLKLSGDGDNVYVGGAFKQINQLPHHGLAALRVVPPETVATPSAGFYNVDQSISLKCIGLSCASTFYTTDGSDPTTSSSVLVYKDPIPIMMVDTTLRYFSQDNTGNPEAPKTASYIFDNWPPVTTVSIASGLKGRSDDRAIALDCIDFGNSGCGITYYTIDGTEPNTLSSVYEKPIIIFQGSDAKPMVVRFYSVDKAGNSESPAAIAGNPNCPDINCESYTVDLVSPTTTATPTSTAFNAKEIVVTLVCDDTVPVVDGVAPVDTEETGCATIYYTKDGSAPTISSPVYDGAIIIDDTTKLRFFSVDGVGNKGVVVEEDYISNYDKIGAFDPASFLCCLLVILMRNYRSSITVKAGK